MKVINLPNQQNKAFRRRLTSRQNLKGIKHIEQIKTLKVEEEKIAEVKEAVVQVNLERCAITLRKKLKKILKIESLTQITKETATPKITKTNQLNQIDNKDKINQQLIKIVKMKKVHVDLKIDLQIIIKVKDYKRILEEDEQEMIPKFTKEEVVKEIIEEIFLGRIIIIVNTKTIQIKEEKET
jgi:hypothetical protein